MNDEQMTDVILEHIRLLFPNQKDRNDVIEICNEVTNMLHQPLYVKAVLESGVLLVENNFELKTRKFIEALRIIANTIEVFVIEQEKKK